MALTQKAVLAAVEDQKLADGNGLYLIVKKGRKRWAYIFQIKGRRREMGLGGFPDVSLAEARRKAGEARLQVLQGEDPIRERTASAWDFGTYAQKVVKDRKVHWREGAGSERSWNQSLKHLAALDGMGLDDIETVDVLNILRPIWSSTPETAHMARMRAETIFDMAIAEGFRTKPNPARWKGHLQRLLPKRERLVRGHFSALPYDKAPAFLQSLETKTSTAAKTLRLVILTASRSKMIAGALWTELDGDVLTIPAVRMKHKRDFVIPLSRQAQELLEGLPRVSEYIFPARKDHVQRKILADLTRPHGVTVHGFRSTFKDWASEQTEHSWETSEHALAHQVGDMTSRAYRRGTSFEKRRQLMQDWADFLSTKA